MEITKILGVALVGVAGAAVGYNLTKEGQNNTRMAIGKMADKFGMKKRSETASSSTNEATIKETINGLNDKIYTLYKNQELSEEQWKNLQKSILNLMIDGEESLEKFKSNIESQIKYELNKNQ
ncbi:MAG: hypothetical protein BWY04_01239 [candidate division CPR1 bacterium ADurb.Bin160]|uniref:Uncharacterized protein n=1 Tax=candidate division CPR1 bacterium ADurb.Bin160 TaxID=1852826 RepID=A0A1V5ZKY9_9BACT|nr:MAG: hypothetical protein BWY04_01239 [candidate division CPR1 bacterium ADurb.Bin160]